MAITYTTSESETIKLHSTSNVTADASSIVLNETELIKTSFYPKIIKKTSDPKECVAGTLVHEKKRKTDDRFPVDKKSKRDIHCGDTLEITLDHHETYRLFNGLKALYNVSGSIDSIEGGTSTYRKAESPSSLWGHKNEDVEKIIELLKTKPALTKPLLELVIKDQTGALLEQTLMNLDDTAIHTLSAHIATTQFDKVLSFMKQNMANQKEEDWQVFFADNQWVLSQIFSAPYTYFQAKSYIGGKALDNRCGRLSDYIVQNPLTKNIAIIEIKTPVTPLIGQLYRDNAYCLHHALSGAINQILDYKQTFLQNYYAARCNIDSEFYAFDPLCYLIIGRAGSLSKQQIASFELYRKSQHNVTIITFDELTARIENLLSIFRETDENDFALIEEDYDALPF